jgi:hypothetical protein
MELNDHFGNLSEYRKKFIIMAITSLIRLDNSNVCKNNIRDKSNYLLNPKTQDVFSGTPASWTLSLINTKLSGVNYSLMNFKKWDKLLFVTYTVNFSLLLTQLHFNNTHIA